jgi:hypothetical protein
LTVFSLIKADWYKRRRPDKSPLTPISWSVLDFKKEHNHFCTISVEYDDNSKEDLIARVLYNKWQDHWTVDGMKVRLKLENHLPKE